MKDSQREELAEQMGPKYIKANNERFSTFYFVTLTAP